MATFQHRTSAAFRVLNPVSGAWAQFVGNRLDIDESDPNFPFVAAEAARNPEIIAIATGLQCPYCGDVFSGKTGRANRSNHIAANHPNEADAELDADHAAVKLQIVKAREGFACDVCQPVQTFGTEADLAAHVRLLHGSPFVNADGKGVPEDVRDRLGADGTPDPGDGNGRRDQAALDRAAADSVRLAEEAVAREQQERLDAAAAEAAAAAQAMADADAAEAEKQRERDEADAEIERREAADAADAEAEAADIAKVEKAKKDKGGA